MPKSKKNIKVRDLKPNKDAKGGGAATNQSMNQSSNQSSNQSVNQSAATMQRFNKAETGANN